MPIPTLEEMVRGQRVRLHPATDLWMRGARYGTVVGCAHHQGKDMLMVGLDGREGRPIMLAWQDVTFMADLGQG